jgi:hypothetical protein
VEVIPTGPSKDTREKIRAWEQRVDRITSPNSGESCLWFDVADAGTLGGPAEVQIPGAQGLGLALKGRGDTSCLPTLPRFREKPHSKAVLEINEG